MQEEDGGLFSLIYGDDSLKVEPKPWMTGGEFSFTMVTNDTIISVINLCIESGLYALDLECTGLDNRVFDGETNSKIVGCCLSPDGKRGYYIPLRHQAGTEHNVSWTTFKREMIRLVNSKARAIFHNGKFDQEFLQFCGGDPIGEWDNPKSWEDTLILAYLADSRAKQRGLKFLSKTKLGMEMIELEELFPKDQVKTGHLDFSLLDPNWMPVLWYACSDAICTYKLYPILAPMVLSPGDDLGSQEFIYQIEKLCVASTRWMERTRVLFDHVKAEELIRDGQKDWINSLNEVYKSASELLGRDVRPGYFKIMQGQVSGLEGMKFDPDTLSPGFMDRVEAARAKALAMRLDPTTISGGKKKVETIQKSVPSLVAPGVMDNINFPLVYDILAPVQLGSLLRECKVPGLKATEKSGQVSTAEDELDSVLEKVGDSFPFAGRISYFRKVSRALSVYLLPIIEDAAPDHTLRFSYNAHSLDTGRFSAPVSKNGNNGGTRFPIQGAPTGFDPKRPSCLLRVRECVISRPGKFIAAIDLSGVELRIITNISREPKWLREFFHCSSCDKMFSMGVEGETPEAPPPYCPDCGSDRIGDLHTLTGVSIYGDEAPKRDNWKQLRGFAKGTNFSLCYGGGGNAVVAATGCDKSEGWRIKNKFDATYKVLKMHWNDQHSFARHHKMVMTALGRRMPLPDIDSELGGLRAQAERNAVNSPVQGFCADLIKLAMGLIYVEVKRRNWIGKVNMLITMHDELVFEIDKDVLEEAINMIVPIMTRNKAVMKLGWPVPLTSDVEIGFNWTVPWDLKKIKHYGKCPPELEGCFNGVKTSPVKKEEVKTDKSPPKPTRVYKISAYSLDEVEKVARMLHGGGDHLLKVEAPDGSDMTGTMMAVWGGPLPSVVGGSN